MGTRSSGPRSRSHIPEAIKQPGDRGIGMPPSIESAEPNRGCNEPGFLTEYRAYLAVLEAFGAAGSAQAVRRCIEIAEDWHREHQLATMSLQEAANESGYSYSAVQQWVSSGRIPNAGDVYKPLVRRGDLPRKPGGHVRSVEGELAEVILDGR